MSNSHITFFIEIILIFLIERDDLISKNDSKYLLHIIFHTMSKRKIFSHKFLIIHSRYLLIQLGICFVNRFKQVCDQWVFLTARNSIALYSLRSLISCKSRIKLTWVPDFVRTDKVGFNDRYPTVNSMRFGLGCAKMEQATRPATTCIRFRVNDFNNTINA